MNIFAYWMLPDRQDVELVKSLNQKEDFDMKKPAHF